METLKCSQCKCNIYLHNKINDYAPGLVYKENLYCSKCVEAVYFLEDIESDEETIRIINKPIPKTQYTSSLICPSCNIPINSVDHICSKCKKIHPLYLRKPKKKRRKRK